LNSLEIPHRPTTSTLPQTQCAPEPRTPILGTYRDVGDQAAPFQAAPDALGGEAGVGADRDELGAGEAGAVEERVERVALVAIGLLAEAGDNAARLRVDRHLTRGRRGVAAGPAYRAASPPGRCAKPSAHSNSAASASGPSAARRAQAAPAAAPPARRRSAPPAPPRQQRPAPGSLADWQARRSPPPGSRRPTCASPRPGRARGKEQASAGTGARTAHRQRSDGSAQCESV
jgi:hypothetical protein